ncbi:MAG: hypothetical protein DRJ61_00930 [Acidobacteria bacterium]|nr:MAG: hypothetical protein DRJ65_13145 [Acidobacteriota bacterium]RLE36405.1 MAG: hypothetical protein DRJ61_00930 [Acidobacteriota bacterium]
MKKPENLRLLILVGILVVAGGWLGIRMMGDSGLVGGESRAENLEWQGHSLPTLGSIEVGDEVASEARVDRNPFLYGPPPTPTPDPRPRPTPAAVPTRRPPPPRPSPTPTPVGWTRPPNFTMEYLGNFGPPGRRVAVFRKQVGEDTKIKVAIEGGVVGKKFIVRQIDLESVIIGFVGFPEKEKTRVPLAEE